RIAGLVRDLWDRDFTINAIGLDVRVEEAAYVDPTGGMADLENGIVRITHAGAIADDPARALRAIRMALQFGFVIEPETQAAIRAVRGQLGRISAERIRDAFLKLIMLPQPAKAVRLLHDYGLLDEIIPELAPTRGCTQSPPHHEDVFDHTLSVLRIVSQIDRDISAATLPPTSPITHLAPLHAHLRDHLNRPIDGNFNGHQLLRLAALFHDCGKPAARSVDPDGRIRFFQHEHIGAKLTQQRLSALKMSNAAVKYVSTTVRGHMRPFSLTRNAAVSRRAIYRFYKKTGLAGIDICLHSLADHLARDRQDDTIDKLFALTSTLLTHYFEAYEDVVQPPKLIDGRDLIRELGIKPGKEIGRILAAITEAQASGDITTREEAFALAGKTLGD
ncbi:MAG TPA: HD domain-containing protein, partial [Anaerolineae bacterium]|nr:HD domain-containing protein [Anaerolineae bacterium]